MFDVDDLFEEIPASKLVPRPMKRTKETLITRDKKALLYKKKESVLPVDAKALVKVMEDESPEGLVVAREIEVEQQKAFIEAYIRLVNTNDAAVETGIPLQRVARWRKESKAFERIYNSVQGIVGQSLETEAVRRAYKGSDRMLIKLLEAYFPERFGRRTQIWGTGPQGELEVTVSNWADLAKSAAVKLPVIDITGEVEDVRELSVGVYVQVENVVPTQVGEWEVTDGDSGGM